MPHLSGYAGAVTFTGGGSDTVFGPTTSELKLNSWEITQETDSFEAKSKGDAWYSTFPTASRWFGTMTFLVQDMLANDQVEDMEIRGSGLTDAVKTFDAVFKTSADGDAYTGQGIITRMRTTDPLDGPVEQVVEFKGGSTLTSPEIAVVFVGVGV
jgi:hypothetical protein